MARFVNRIPGHKASSFQAHETHHGFEKNALTPHMNHSWRRFFRENTSTAVLGGMFLFSLLFSSSFENFNHFLKTSLVGTQDIVFTGTVMPISHVPDWTQLSSQERNYRFDHIPSHKIIPIPKYDLQAMKQGMEWSEDNASQRNAYVTYPVPYLGNYDLNAREYTGSHSAIDIKVPIGTPVVSIANGQVVKVKDVSYGGGKYIVISHPNVPSLEDKNVKTTLFSSYLHLSEQLVSEGEIVEKGQLIGKSGNTGMSTAPHLHFQLDSQEAPFSPYWPFTQDEQRVAGYSSAFEAVRNGLGQDRAKMYTVHPIDYVEKYKTYVTSGGLLADASGAIPVDSLPTGTLVGNETPQNTTSSYSLGSSRYSIDSVVTPTDEASNKKEKETQSEQKQPENQPENKEDQDDDFQDEKKQTEKKLEEKQSEQEPPRQETKPDYYSLDFVMDGGYMVDVPNEVWVRVLNADELDEDIFVSSTLKSRAKVTPEVLTKYDFVGGVAKIKVTPEIGIDFQLVAESDKLGQVVSQTMTQRHFSDVSGDHFAAAAIQDLVQEGVVTGYDDGTFLPDKVLNRVEGLAMTLRRYDFDTAEEIADFFDVEQSAWYAEYINIGTTHGIVKGNPDGSFEPGADVNRAAFLALVLRAGGYDLPEVSRGFAADIPVDAWFAQYFAFGHENSILPREWTMYRQWSPEAPVTRADAAYILYKLKALSGS